MIKGESVLAIIPARGGSKGLHGKNIKDLCGKPLIVWSIETAKNCRDIDRIIVSTDDKEIADIAISYEAEVPFIRPIELATDMVTLVHVMQHTLFFLITLVNHMKLFFLYRRQPLLLRVVPLILL